MDNGIFNSKNCLFAILILIVLIVVFLFSKKEKFIDTSPINSNMDNLLASKVPWGVYIADTSLDNDVIYDLYGTNKRFAQIIGQLQKVTGPASSGTAPFTYITGTSQTQIMWPNNSISSNFTICSITRYNGNARGRILNSPDRNFLHGHWNGLEGVSHYDEWKTPTSTGGNINNGWVVMCGSNSTTETITQISGTTDRTVKKGGNGNIRLSINTTENSDFALAAVFIWDRHLSSSELQIVSQYLTNYLLTATHCSTIQNLINTMNSKSDVTTLTQINAPYYSPLTITDKTNMDTLLANKKPWGLYVAETDLSNDALYDLYGTNKRYAVINGQYTKVPASSSSIPHITGTTATQIRWSIGSIPTNFTICSITKYNGNTRRAILQGSGQSLLVGHWNNQTGVVHNDGWRTEERNNGNRLDWLVTCTTNSTSETITTIINKKNITLTNNRGGNGNPNAFLAINTGNWSGDTSDFALSTVFIWDTQLTSNELILVSRYLRYYLANNEHCDTIKNLINTMNSKPDVEDARLRTLPYKAPLTQNELTNMDTILASKRPWGIYVADTPINNNVIYDLYGNNGRYAGCVNGTMIKSSASGNGASVSIPFITGTTDTIIQWLPNSIPEKFTICSITRYNGNNKRRILASLNIDFKHGHHDGKVGLSDYNGWKTADNSYGNQMDWVVMCGSNSESQEVTQISNDSNRTINKGGQGNGTLSINNGDQSEFALAAVFIWEQHLTTSELQNVARYLRYYLSTGTHCSTITNLINNINSTKDVTQFTNSINLYSPVLSNELTRMDTLLANKRPWGIFSADTPIRDNRLCDIYGTNKRYAVCTAGTMTKVNANASSVIPFIGGDTNTEIKWGYGSIPNKFTICSITRYSGNNRGRILNSSDRNFIHGHYGGQRGVSHYDGWRTRSDNLGNVTDWLVMCGTNSQTEPIRQIADRVNRTNRDTGGAGNGTLTINTSEKSQFQLSIVMIWDQCLTSDELIMVSRYLRYYLSTGVHCSTIANLINALPSLPDFTAPLINLPTLLTSTLTNVELTTMNNILDKKKPWGVYVANTDILNNKYLFDLYGNNGRIAKISGTGLTKTSNSGNGATVSIPLIKGAIGTQIIWPDGSIPLNYTICSITRYAGSNKRGILQGKTVDLIHGHWSQKRGVAHNGGWKTEHTMRGIQDNWLVMCTTNSFGEEITSIADDLNVTQSRGGRENTVGNLSINTGSWNDQTSEFDFNCVFIWDQQLTSEELVYVSRYLRYYLSTGVHCSNIQNLINNITNTNDYKMISALNSTTLSNVELSNMNNILSSKKPWGMYIADAEIKDNIMFDLYGNNKRYAQCINNSLQKTNSSSASGVIIPCIDGKVDTKILWSNGSIPDKFTICSITRYSGTYKNRILNSTSFNFFHGHNEGKRAVSNYEGIKTNDVSTGNQMDWLVMCGTNSQTEETTQIGDDKNLTVNKGGRGNGVLSINSSNLSDFQLSAVIIWDTQLSSEELMVVSRYLRYYLLTGIHCSVIQNLINNLPNTTDYKNLNENLIISLPSPDSVFLNKRPYAIYLADTINSNDTVINDLLGDSNKKATVTKGSITKQNTSGNGASIAIPSIAGTTNTEILWPAGTIPQNTFSMCSITRYTSTNRQRILNVENGPNFLHGHWGGNRGLVANDGDKAWQSKNTRVTTNDIINDWVVVCSSNSSTENIIVMVDDIDSTQNRGGPGGNANSALAINRGNYGKEKSDFALSLVMIWDKHLTSEELQVMSKYLNEYLKTGKHCNYINNLLNKTSLPLNTLSTVLFRPYVGNDVGNYVFRFEAKSGIVPTKDLTNNFSVSGSATTISDTKRINVLNLNNTTLLTNRYPITPNTSLSFWIYYTGQNNVTVFCGQWWPIYYESNKLTSIVYYTGGGPKLTETTVQPNKWVHYTFVIDDTNGKFSIYVNGILNNSVTASNTWSGPNGWGKLANFNPAENKFYIGSFIRGNTPTENNFTGLLDDIRIYNYALNDSQVRRIYEQNIDPSAIVSSNPPMSSQLLLPAFSSQSPAFSSQLPAFSSQSPAILPAFSSQSPAFSSQLPAFSSQLPAFSSQSPAILPAFSSQSPAILPAFSSQSPAILPAFSTETSLLPTFSSQSPAILPTFSSQSPSLLPTFSTETQLLPAYSTETPLLPTYSSQSPSLPTVSTEIPILPTFSSQSPSLPTYSSETPLLPAYAISASSSPYLMTSSLPPYSAETYIAPLIQTPFYSSEKPYSTEASQQQATMILTRAGQRFVRGATTYSSEAPRQQTIIPIVSQQITTGKTTAKAERRTTAKAERRTTAKAGRRTTRASRKQRTT